MTGASRNQGTEAREARRVFVRVKQLHENPIQGNFDLAHLKAVHAYLFQDFPEHRPGSVRDDTTERWTKQRVLEGWIRAYAVHYAHDAVEARISAILRAFGGTRGMKGKSLDAASARLAALYGDLDHAHGFYEGNSRTLREFTRELALASGFSLDWVGTRVGADERNRLYVARDIAVLERAFPGLTPDRAMETGDRAEYEASFTLEGLRRRAGDWPLAAIVRQALSRSPD